jgi:hypothetical protein
MLPTRPYILAKCFQAKHAQRYGQGSEACNVFPIIFPNRDDCVPKQAICLYGLDKVHWTLWTGSQRGQRYEQRVPKDMGSNLLPMHYSDCLAAWPSCTRHNWLPACCGWPGSHRSPRLNFARNKAEGRGRVAHFALRAHVASNDSLEWSSLMWLLLQSISKSFDWAGCFVNTYIQKRPKNHSTSLVMLKVQEFLFC